MRRILNRPPVVRDFLIVQMPDTRYVGRVPLTLRPGDGLCLGLECLEHAIPLFLDDIVHNSGPFPPAFGAGLNEDCRHVSSPRLLSIEASIAQSQRLQQLRTTCRRAQRPAWRALCVGASNVSLCATTPKLFCSSAAQR